MKVSDVMTRAVVAVHEDTPFTEIVSKLIAGNMSGVPVVDVSRAVVGVVSESDLLAKEAYPLGTHPKRRFLEGLLAGKSPYARKAAGLSAKDLMTSPAICVSPNESIHAAARLMLEAGVKRLPVVSKNRLVGIISRQDALRVFAGTDEELRRSIEALLTRCFFTPPEHDIRVGVSKGIVRLEGVVSYESDVRVASHLVAELDGVVHIINLLSFRYRDPTAHDLATRVVTD